MALLQKSYNTLLTYFSSVLSNLHNAWFRLPQLHASSGICSVAHHNPYINAFFVYLLMQELFIDKIHFFKFRSMSDKPRRHQLKIITSTLSTVQASLNLSIRTGKYHQGRGSTLCSEEIQSLTNLSSTLKFLTP